MKYLGVILEEGSKFHLQMRAVINKMEMASSQLGVVVGLWDTVPWNLRRDRYVEKVRGAGLHCGDIWGTAN